MNYETLFLQALLLTILVEGLIIASAVRIFPALKKRKFNAGRIIGAGTIPSMATLPYFWLVLPAYISSHSIRIVTGEISIFVFESFIICLLLNLSLRWSVLLSLIANVASICAGLAVF